MSERAGGFPPDERLDLGTLLQWLERDGLLDTRQVARLRFLASEAQPAVDGETPHPLELIAAQNLVGARGGQPLDLETLSRWLAARARLPYLRIDPLKIDLAAVTGVIKRA